MNANVINGGTVNSAANAIVSLEGMSSKEMEVLLKAIKKEIPKRKKAEVKAAKIAKREALKAAKAAAKEEQRLAIAELKARAKDLGFDVSFNAKPNAKPKIVKISQKEDLSHVGLRPVALGPMVPINKSVFDDGIVSLETGVKWQKLNVIYLALV